jgi:hypothetical protein
MSTNEIEKGHVLLHVFFVLLLVSVVVVFVFLWVGVCVGGGGSINVIFCLLICVLLFSHCRIFLASNCMEAHLQRWHMAALHKKWDKWYAIFLLVFHLS